MSDTIEVNERPLSPEEIQRDYVNIKAAGQILRDCSETTARRRIKLYETGTQRKIATITEVVNGGVVKLYPRQSILEVAAYHDIIPSVTVYERIEVPPQIMAVPHAVRFQEPVKSHVSQGLATSDKDRQQVAMGGGGQIAHLTQVVKFWLIGTWFIGVLIISILLLFLIQSVRSVKNNIESLRQDYRDSRLIQRVEDEEKNFTNDIKIF